MDQHPRFQFRDRFTGLPPTEADWAEMRVRARQILDNWRYSSPEQLDWAMRVDPEKAEEAIALA